MTKKIICEAIGTFCLVFAGTGAIVVNEITSGAISHLGVSLTFGLIVMAMIYSIGEISGAHINPAVTLAFANCSEDFQSDKLIPYISAQLTGAIIASLLIRFFISRNSTLGRTTPSGSESQSFILEILLKLDSYVRNFDGFNRSKRKKHHCWDRSWIYLLLLKLSFAGPISGPQ